MTIRVADDRRTNADAGSRAVIVDFSSRCLQRGVSRTTRDSMSHGARYEFCRWRVLIAGLLLIAVPMAADARAFHDQIPEKFRGTWAPTAAECTDPDGVNQVFVDADSVNYYEGNDYLLLGVAFGGALTQRGGSGDLFNGRFTGRAETNLLGESSIRMEIDDRDPNTMYRYSIGADGQPIAAREVKDVRCVGK